MISSYLCTKLSKGQLAWIGILLLGLLPLGLSTYGVGFIIQVLIFAIFAMSLDLLVGYMGLLSLNHATFFGIGAYTVAIILSKVTDNFWLAMTMGILIPAVAAGILGLIVLRSKGPYFLLMTLAFNQMIFALAWKWRTLTGGDDGIAGISMPKITSNLVVSNNYDFYYLTLLFFLITGILLWKFINNRGIVLIGIRESETRMQALGYNTAYWKWLVYVIAGAMAGMAGVFYVYFNGFISPQELNWSMSGMVVLMVIIGGPGTIFGPVIGAGIILTLQYLVSAYTDRWPMVMGIVFIVCVLYARDGVYGLILELRKKVESYYASSARRKSVQSSGWFNNSK